MQNNKSLMGFALALSLFSCQSAYVSQSQMEYAHGVASATPNQSGLLIGGTVGGETFALDLAHNVAGGTDKVVHARQSHTFLGVRVSAPRSLTVQPYASVGAVGRSAAFVTAANDHGTFEVGSYARVGALVPMGEGLCLDLSFQAMDFDNAGVGGRSSVDLDSAGFLVGFSVQF